MTWPLCCLCTRRPADVILTITDFSPGLYICNRCNSKFGDTRSWARNPEA